MELGARLNIGGKMRSPAEHWCSFSLLPGWCYGPDCFCHQIFPLWWTLWFGRVPPIRCFVLKSVIWSPDEKSNQYKTHNSCWMATHIPTWSVAFDPEALTNFQLIPGNHRSQCGPWCSHLDEGDTGLWVFHSSDRFWELSSWKTGSPVRSSDQHCLFFCFCCLIPASTRAAIFSRWKWDLKTNILFLLGTGSSLRGEKKLEVSGEILFV